jgi:signal transduction histidine kinase
MENKDDDVLAKPPHGADFVCRQLMRTFAAVMRIVRRSGSARAMPNAAGVAQPIDPQRTCVPLRGIARRKSMDALTRIRTNGRHLLGQINTVLDIARIESGQFKLNLAEYALDSVVETMRAVTES